MEELPLRRSGQPRDDSGRCPVARCRSECRDRQTTKARAVVGRCKALLPLLVERCNAAAYCCARPTAARRRWCGRNEDEKREGETEGAEVKTTC